MRPLPRATRRRTSRPICVALIAAAALMAGRGASGVTAQVTVATIAIPTDPTTPPLSIAIQTTTTTQPPPSSTAVVPTSTVLVTSSPVLVTSSTSTSDTNITLALPVITSTTTGRAVTTALPVLSTTPKAGAAASTTGATTTNAPSSTNQATPTTSAGPATLTALRIALDGALASPKGQKSVLVSMDGLGNVYDLGADTALPPASTIKITAAGAGLLRLGPEYRFTTEIGATGPIENGVLTGDLVVRGTGDPTLNAADLKALAVDVAKQLKLVRGDLVVDTNGYDASTKNPGWKDKFTPFEVGLLSSFMVGGNHRADLATLQDPDLANLVLLRDALAKAGVIVAGTTGRAPWAAATTIATHGSASLSTLVARMLKASENTYAEQVLRAIGGGSTGRGVDRVRAMFTGAALAAPTQTDGSGLSLVDRASARQLVGWLRHLDRSTVAELFRQSLPVACKDGTLKGRLCGTPAAQRVLAKTGTLDFVRTIAGYGRTASGRTFTVAILLDNVPNGRAVIDQALATIAGFSG